MRHLDIGPLPSALLLAILSFYSFRLWTHARSNIHQNDIQEAIADRNDRTLFNSDSGIDVFGKRITFISAEHSSKTLVFLLHKASLSKDLTFWKLSSCKRCLHSLQLSYIWASVPLRDQGTEGSWSSAQFGEGSSM